MWKVDGTEASFAAARWSCNVDLADDVLGISNVCVWQADEQITLAGSRLLRVGTRSRPVADAYARGDDLIVSIPESPRWPLRMQVYWRAMTSADWFGCEAIVSIQTSSQDAASEIEVTSQMGSVCSAQDSNSGQFQLPVADLTYLQISHSSNLGTTTVVGNEIKHRVFAGHLEKGVIRRARILGIFIPTSKSESLIHELRTRFERSAPPLTT